MLTLQKRKDKKLGHVNSLPREMDERDAPRGLTAVFGKTFLEILV
jgi:hypothetical protein